MAMGAGLALLADAGAAPAQIDLSATQQVIRGFGGATVFQPPGLPASLTATELDTLFGNGPEQIGFTLLRIRVAPDDAWRAVELAHARGALARGAQVIATPWSPPAAMKTNNSLVRGSLLPSAYADYANYLNAFATYMADNGAPLYAISVQNEPDIVVDYESCDWTPAQMLAFCRDHARAITATRVIAPESFQFRRAMSDPLLNDVAATEAIDIIGGHLYGAGLAPYPLAAAKGKEVWMTEYLDLSTDWAGALATGRQMHDCLATANFNAYIWWYARRFYGPLGEDGVVTKRGWVMAQFSKFVRPGYVRVTATNNPTAGVRVSAYQREKLVIVAVNQATEPVVQDFTLAGTSGSVAAVTPWVTSATANLERQAAIRVTGGTFTATLPAGSVTTFEGNFLFPAPTITVPPRSVSVATGGTAVLDVTAGGSYPTYQWSRNGIPVRGATEQILTLKNVSGADAGSYTVTVANSGGAVTSAPAALTIASGGASRLANLSTRAQVANADDVVIAGFVIGGTAARPVLVRVAGPVLRSAFGVDGALDDPILEVRDGAGVVVATSDNWDAGLEPVIAAAGAFPWPRGSRDAALRVALPPGAYTAMARSRGAAGGIVLVEVYDVGDGTGPGLINLSTRATVGTDERVQIGGFVLAGGSARTVVIRASGPALQKRFALGGALADPVIELRRAGRDAPLAVSDDWRAFVAPHFAGVGAFAWLEESRDAALVTTLEPGAYSVVVSGKGSAAGVALFEVYAEP